MKKFIPSAWVLCAFLLLIGFAVKQNRDHKLQTYKDDLKQYVAECGTFSETEQQIIGIAIDHIETQATIDQPKLISVYPLSQKYPADAAIDLQSETGRSVKASDWQVDIGDPATHKNFSAIIDGETLEFVMQIPIA